MSPSQKLILVKIVHTLIWVFFNIVIFYLLFAAITGRINQWVWICIGLILIEGAVLAMNKLKCPLTNIAERYTDSREANFDIYLPLWIAQHNKTIYTTIFGVAVVILIYKLL